MISNKPICSCLGCKKEITSNNLTKHHNSKQCLVTQDKLKHNCEKGAFIKTCRFCKILTTNKRHETLCESNPNKQISINQHIIAKQTGVPYIVTQETKDKYIKAGTGRVKSNESRLKTSASMKIAVNRSPESYRGRYNRGHVKQIECSNGFLVLGSWEHTFVEFCISNNIEITQPIESFSYVWNGDRTYFPDFYLPESDSFIEVKGFKTNRDLAKWEYMTKIHNKKLIVVEESAIKLINNSQMSRLKLMTFEYN